MFNGISILRQCDFVKARLVQRKSLQTIAEEALAHCLAEDPRKSQGIGGDNMTFMVVALKPLDRLAQPINAVEDTNTVQNTHAQGNETS
jgi:hypothetical protein